MIVVVLGTGLLFLFRYVRHRENAGERRPIVPVTYMGLYAALIGLGSRVAFGFGLARGDDGTWRIDELYDLGWKPQGLW